MPLSKDERLRRKADYQRKYRNRYPEKVKAIAKAYQAKRKERQYWRKAFLKREYNLSVEEYDRLFKAQDGRCAICGVTREALTRNLAVDHDHITGKIRGLLCNICNRGIGYLRDDVLVLTKAIQYLTKGTA